LQLLTWVAISFLDLAAYQSIVDILHHCVSHGEEIADLELLVLGFLCPAVFVPLPFLFLCVFFAIYILLTAIN
jgi:hypothetical protein